MAAAAPWLAVVLGLSALVMGVSTCLAYMSIGLERYQVERGYKAVHDPMKGQDLAVHLIRYGAGRGAAPGRRRGRRVRALEPGFLRVGRPGVYAVGDEAVHPGYVDFLAYALINPYRIVDLLDLANRALGQIGPAAGGAVPDLIRVLQDADETVRCRAAEALGQIGAEATIPPLTDELADPSPAVQEAATRALGAFRLAAEGAGPGSDRVFRAGLGDADPRVRASAAEALGKRGAPAGGAVATLSSGNPSVASVPNLSMGALADDGAGDRDVLTRSLARQLRERLAARTDLGVLGLAAVYGRRRSRARWALDLMMWYGYFGPVDLGATFCGAPVVEVLPAGPAWPSTGVTLLANQFRGRMCLHLAYTPGSSRGPRRVRTPPTPVRRSPGVSPR